MRPERKRQRRLHQGGLATAGAGLAVLLALAAQCVAGPADNGLLLIVCEAATGIGLAIAGFVMMVVGADPFDDADHVRGDRINLD